MQLSCGLLLTSVAAACATLVFSLSTAPSDEFVEVRPQLWRYNGEFAFLPSPAARSPVAVWLVEVKSSWILIDAGASSPEYREPFFTALKQKLSSSSSVLRLLLRKSRSQPSTCPLGLHALLQDCRMPVNPASRMLRSIQ